MAALLAVDSPGSCRSLSVHDWALTKSSPHRGQSVERASEIVCRLAADGARPLEHHTQNVSDRFLSTVVVAVLAHNRTRRSESGKKVREAGIRTEPSPSNTLISLELNQRERFKEYWLGVRDGIRNWLVTAA